MTDRQRKFAEEYVRTRDPRASYRAAYPRVKNDAVADSGAWRLLREAEYAEVQAYIEKLMQRAADEAVADAHEVLAGLSEIARGQTQDQVVVTEGLGEGVSRARIIDKRVSERDRLRALELLAKYHQLLNPKPQVEITNSSGGMIVLAEATDGEL